MNQDKSNTNKRYPGYTAELNIFQRVIMLCRAFYRFSIKDIRLSFQNSREVIMKISPRTNKLIKKHDMVKMTQLYLAFKESSSYIISL